MPHIPGDLHGIAPKIVQNAWICPAIKQRLANDREAQACSSVKGGVSRAVLSRQQPGLRVRTDISGSHRRHRRLLLADREKHINGGRVAQMSCNMQRRDAILVGHERIHVRLFD